MVTKKKKKSGRRRDTSRKKGVPKGAAPSADLEARSRKILAALKRAYPDSHCALHHMSAYQLSVATILSAQCTDKRVNLVTPEFFRRWPTVKALARAKPPEVEQVVRSTGFFKNKARNLIGFAQKVTKEYGGMIPRTMDELIGLPGFGRKTANVILGNAYGVPGLVVDTHVGRLSRRLGLTREKDPVKVEWDLAALLPKKEWTMFSHRMIDHGRAICDARKPLCEKCPLEHLCPKVGVV